MSDMHLLLQHLESLFSRNLTAQSTLVAALQVMSIGCILSFHSWTRSDNLMLSLNLTKDLFFWPRLVLSRHISPEKQHWEPRKQRSSHLKWYLPLLSKSPVPVTFPQHLLTAALCRGIAFMANDRRKVTTRKLKKFQLHLMRRVLRPVSP